MAVTLPEQNARVFSFIPTKMVKYCGAPGFDLGMTGGSRGVTHRITAYGRLSLIQAPFEGRDLAFDLTRVIEQ